MDVPWPIFTSTFADFSTPPPLTPAQRDRQRDAAIVRMMMPTLEYDEFSGARGGKIRRVLKRRRRKGGEGGSVAVRTGEEQDVLQRMEEGLEAPPPSYDELYGAVSASSSSSPVALSHSLPPPSPTYSRFSDAHLLPSRAQTSAPSSSPPFSPLRPTTSSSSTTSSAPFPAHVRRASLDSGYETLGSRVATRTGEEGDADEGARDGAEGEASTGERRSRWKQLGRAFSPSQVRLGLSAWSDTTTYDPFDGRNAAWQAAGGSGYYF
ncbi:hypothetical protein JCM6882_005964 [Rhodosporidiobolus microsporus]